MTVPPILDDRRKAGAYRGRVLVVLAGSTGLGGLGIFASLTVASLLGERLLSEGLAGVPVAAFSLGLAAVVLPLSALMSRFGRRPGLFLGYSLGFVGSGLAALSTRAENLALLLGGMVFMGVMYGTALLSRYAAADVTDAASRGRAISRITWALVIGAVVGPNLTEVSGRWMTSLGMPELAGPFAICMFGAASAAALVFLFLRPDPLIVARLAAEGMEGTERLKAASLADLLRLRDVRIGLLAIALVQFVMVAVMAITTLHAITHGHSLAFAGSVISAHFVGMFGLSPIAGSLTDRFGRRLTMGAGQVVTLIGSVVAALAPIDRAGLMASLALIGLGWNLNLVGASALITDAVSVADRTKVQGAADFVNGGVSVLGSLASGAMLAALGFAGLGMIGIAMMIPPLAASALMRKRAA